LNRSKNLILALNPRSIEEYPFILANGPNIFVSYKKSSGKDWDIYLGKSHDQGVNWRNPVKIVNSSADEVEAIMAVHESEIYIVYEGNATESFDIWFTKSNDSGMTWSEPVNLDPSPEYEGHPYIVVDNLGGIYVTYDGTRGIWFVRSLDRGDSWSSPKKISNSTLSEWNPFMAADKDGVYLTYASLESGNSDVWFSKTTDRGLSWSPPSRVDLSAGFEGRPAMTALNGTIYVTYTASDLKKPINYDVKFTKSVDGGKTWSTPRTIQGSRAFEARQFVAADQTGIYVVYQGSLYGNWDIWSSRSLDDGNTWSSPVEIDRTEWSESTPAMAVDNGTLYAVYNSYRDKFENVRAWFSRSDDGGGIWSPPVKVGE
jgi:hypothetical protein